VFGSWEINSEAKIVDGVFKAGMDAHSIARAKTSQHPTRKKEEEPITCYIGGVSLSMSSSI
jgi:hypothetical protein